MKKWSNLAQILSDTSPPDTYEIIVYNGSEKLPAAVPKEENTTVKIPVCNRTFQSPYSNIDKLFPLNLGWPY